MTKPIPSLSRILAALSIALLLATFPSGAQEIKPAARGSKPTPTEKNAAQIELLETRYRFETNGDSRKEVHARVRINNELGVRQFARLNFDFNRSFQSLEIPFVRVTHASGGTADTLPSAVTDNPNPAVVDYPAYHDVRVKSVRILGLQPDDLLEYRVITTTTHHPLAPDFWLDHIFDRSGVVTHEIFELDLPTSSGNDKENLQALAEDRGPARSARIHLGAKAPAPSTETTGEAAPGRTTYRWRVSSAELAASATSSRAEPGEADVTVSSFTSWRTAGASLGAKLRYMSGSDFNALAKKLYEIQGTAPSSLAPEKLYDFVSTNIRTVDLPLGATGFRVRPPLDTLASGYATAEDKANLFFALSQPAHQACLLALVGESNSMPNELPNPSAFSRVLIRLPRSSESLWLEPSLDVAPFGVVSPDLHGKTAFILQQLLSIEEGEWWVPIPSSVPFSATQHVNVRADVAKDGALKAVVRYSLRGENELTLRIAFHQTPKEKWKDVAQMLALSDGFRGQIVNVTASDPYATKEPFTVEYEISQPKFVDWSKKTVRVPAILPLPGLPDGPTAAQIAANKPLELGTPLTIDLEATIELPAGATAEAPIGTTVNRDYAAFSSKYLVQGNTLHASRSLHFLSSELPASRATDFNAFLHAVQSDQSQLFTAQPPSQN